MLKNLCVSPSCFGSRSRFFVGSCTGTSASSSSDSGFAFVIGSGYDIGSPSATDSVGSGSGSGSAGSATSSGSCNGVCVHLDRISWLLLSAHRNTPNMIHIQPITRTSVK